jgi:glycosyltransferase involved in cell wall biosynthesis
LAGLHIAYFTNSYLPVVSGVVRSVRTFRKALTDLGHIVFVFAQEDGYEDEEPFIFRYHSLPLPLRADVSAAIPVSPFMDRLIPSLKLDVIHAHHPVLLGQAAASKAQELDLPLVFTFHTQYKEYTQYVPLHQEAVQNFLKDTIHTWLRDYMRKCQHIVVPSKSMLDILVQDYGLKSRYTIIPTGIDLRSFSGADGEILRAENGWGDDRVMISIGRLGPEKNWRMLLKSAAIVIRNNPSLRVVIIGDGPERQALLDFSSQLGISERVDFIGEVPFSRVPSYLKAADFFGFASTAETQGLVTLEALAAGLPVVAVNASGTRDILEHDRQGMLVENQPEAIAAAISRLLNEENLLSRFQAAALDRAKDFDINIPANKLINVYEQAMQDKQNDQFVEIA